VNLAPDRNRPTIATLITGVVVALLNWGLTFVPEGVPEEVTSSGYALAIAVVSLFLGKAAQGQLGFLKKKAPWTHDMHQAALVEALSMDPTNIDEFREHLLRNMGVDEFKQALLDMGVPEEDL